MQLLAEYTRKEVKDAIFSIKTTKSHGPGYTSGFFRDAWDTVEEEVTYAILEVMTNGKMLGQLNATVITLIP